MTDDLFLNLAKALAYVVLGGGILLLGYFVHDILTPGKLGEKSRLMSTGRNVNVTIVSASHLVASGLITAMAIWTTHEDFSEGLATTAIFGLFGVVVLTLTEIVIDALTPGKLGELLIEERFHPLSAFMATANVVVGIIVAVSIA